jgi:hypothetical protein
LLEDCFLSQGTDHTNSVTVVFPALNKVSGI